MSTKQLVPLKSIADINQVTLSEKTDPDTPIRYIDIGSVSKSGFNGKHQDFTFETAPSRARRKLRKGSTIIATVRTYLKAVAFFEKPSKEEIVSTGFAVLDPKNNIDQRYLYYRVAADDFVQEVEANSVGVSYPAINPSDLGKLKLSISGTKDEQREIADYLDTKTQTLDKILTAKNHTHTHLSELRQAIITNAVLGTGGATMSTSVKNTWVGATPNHWKITKLSHVARIKTGGTPSRENLDYWTDGNIPWLASGEVNKGIIATVDNHITPLGMANSNATILPIDTVMIALNGQGKTKGMAALLKVPATCNQSLAGVICDKDKINPQYLYYYLKSKYSNIRGIKGEARDGLNLDIIGSIPVPLPPMEEQMAIVEQIERRINKIDTTEVKLSESIKLLEEYRSSLISSVVGGKVEV